MVQCAATAPMVSTADASQFPGNYTSSATDNQGKVVCPFVVPTSTNYRVWFKVYASDATSDSYYIDVDGDTVTPNDCMNRTDRNDTLCPHIFDVGEQIQPCEAADQGQTCFRNTSWLGTGGVGYWWNPLNDRTVQNCGACLASNAVERRLFLTAGTHTISFRSREKNARAYYIIVTSDFSYVPADPAPTPTPSGRCLHECMCNSKWGLIEVPCGTTGYQGACSPCPWSP